MSHGSGAKTTRRRTPLGLDFDPDPNEGDFNTDGGLEVANCFSLFSMLPLIFRRTSLQDERGDLGFVEM